MFGHYNGIFLKRYAQFIPQLIAHRVGKEVKERFHRDKNENTGDTEEEKS